MEYYIDEMQTYMEGLSKVHVEVEHGKEGKVSFAKFLTHEHISQIQNKSGRTIIVISDYYGQCIGDFDEDKARQSLEVLFLTKKMSGNSQSSQITDAVKKSLEILFDFLAKMKKDFRDDSCGALRGLELEKATWNIYDDQPFLDDFYGWVLSLPWKSNLPPFNPAKWTV